MKIQEFKIGQKFNHQVENETYTIVRVTEKMVKVIYTNLDYKLSGTLSRAKNVITKSLKSGQWLSI